VVFASVSLVSVTEENTVPFFISTMKKKYGLSLCLRALHIARGQHYIPWPSVCGANVKRAISVLFFPVCILRLIVLRGSLALG